MSYDVGKPSGCPVKKMSYDVDIPLAQYSRHILQYWIDATANVWIMATRSPPFFPSRVVDRNPSGTAPKVQLSWRRRGTHRSFFEAANDRNVITTWVARDPNNLNFFKQIQLRQQKCRDCTDGELIERTLVPYSTHGQHLDSRKPALAVAVGDHL